VEAIYVAGGQRVSLDHAVARAWFVDEVCWLVDAERLEAALLADGWEPQQTALLPGIGECESTARGVVQSVVDETPNRTIVEVAASDGGWLVLADTDYPGWQASAHGEPLMIYSANGMFRAVKVPPGVDQVIFQYSPRWLLPGLLVTGVTLLILLLLFRTRNPNPSDGANSSRMVSEVDD
jgi:hypothetical protein